MPSWNTFSIAEQTLIRAALAQAPLAGTIQTYGAAMRWAGMQGVPPRSFTADEQRRLVPDLAGVAMDLAAGGLLSLVRFENHRHDGEVVAPDVPLRHVLVDPGNWIWDPTAADRYGLRASEHTRERWSADVYPLVDTTGLPSWEHLSTQQREVLVCAAEASGMLTGAFGIWPDPPAELEANERQAWFEDQFDPLLAFARAGLIEVRHFSGWDSDAYTVIPADSLGQALANPAIRDGEDWGVGVGCVFTYQGLAIWRNAWSTGWNGRLRFD